MQSIWDARLHVGLIMDGNGRWAAARGLPRYFGHRAGARAVRRAVEAAPKLGVGVLTLFAFSADNWRRPETEIAALMNLLQHYLRTEIVRLIRHGVRLTVIGRRDRLSEDAVEAIERAEALTAAGQGLHLRIAIDYSGRAAVLRAVEQAKDIDDLTPESFGALIAGLEAPGNVDLIIRTSGEQRLSDFLLWESAYAELWFTDRLWPDFGAEDLAQAIDSFRSRDRRFGGLSQAAG